MIAGQIRTWPKISMISNRMRIEASIERARKALREQKPVNSNRGYVNSRSEPELYKLSQHMEPHDSLDSSIIHNEHHSDAGSGDELIFLTRRRVSMPDGSFSNMEDKDFFREQHRRRKFMAQFNDSSSVVNGGSKNTSKDSLSFDSDSDSPGSPDSAF